jgi:uncharacterized protein (UPF0147 family)
MDTIIDAIKEVLDEQSLSKTCKQQLLEVVIILEGPGDNRLKASKALAAIETVSENGVPSFVRTQLWNIASLLESV